MATVGCAWLGAHRRGGTLVRMLERQLPPRAPALPTAAPSAGDGALQRVVACVRALFWLKAVGTTAFMSLFFIGYFHLLRNPSGTALEMPLTAVDHWVGFQPWALWPYISLWFYVVIPPSMLTRSGALVRYGLWIGGLCLLGLACFYLWPTAVPRQTFSTEGLAGFDLLRGVDAAGNACPSLHVATAAFSALWIDRLVRSLELGAGLRALNAVWFVLIVWSTVATRQHVWWDVVAGLALALAIAPMSLRSVGLPRRGDIMAPEGNRAGVGR